jgi:glycosyltransferase involved in cell wall biosynthesis
VHLVIAGAGPQEAALRAAAPEDVTFLGYLDRAQALPELYASCDAFVFSSFTEMLGLVVLEAMASGLPVIAAPVGGVADHLHDRENGLAYAPSSAAGMVNALLTSVRDRELARRLASGARAAAQELCWTKEIDRLDASYRELCAMRTAVPA